MLFSFANEFLISILAKICLSFVVLVTFLLDLLNICTSKKLGGNIIKLVIMPIPIYKKEYLKFYNFLKRKKYEDIIKYTCSGVKLNGPILSAFGFDVLSMP